MKFIKNYKSMIILVLCIIVGAVVGLLWGEGASVLKPLGDLFLNMMLSLKTSMVVPFVCFS